MSVVIRYMGRGLSINDYYKEHGWENRSAVEREHIVYHRGAWKIKKYRRVNLGINEWVYLVDVE